MSLDDIGYLSILVRYHDSYDSSAIVCYRTFITFVIAQYEKVCLLAVDNGLEVFWI